MLPIRQFTVQCADSRHAITNLSEAIAGDERPVFGIDRSRFPRCRQYTGRGCRQHVSQDAMSNAHIASLADCWVPRHDVRSRPASRRTDDCPQPLSSFAGCSPRTDSSLRRTAQHGISCSVIALIGAPFSEPTPRCQQAIHTHVLSGLHAASTELEQLTVQALFRHAGFAHQLAYLPEQSGGTTEMDRRRRCAASLDRLGEAFAEPGIARAAGDLDQLDPATRSQPL